VTSMPTRSETIPVDPSDTWRLLVATARGASHEVAGTPNQDAARSAALDALGPGALISAIADGHGNRRHFRSDRGSHFAVDSACECVAAMTDRLGPITRADQLTSLAKTVIIPDIVERWRTTVAADVVDRPLASDEEAEMANAGDEPAVAYGATLLAVLMWDHWMLLMQIGDGDMVALRSNGSVLLPIPDDPSLDGQHTTSMCQSNATDSFRVSVIDLAGADLVGILLGTDGFGNAQAADPWQPAVGADLVDMVRTQGVDWIEGQLPDWVKQCASAEGSADDTTVALLLAPVSDHLVGDSLTVPGQRRAEVTTSATLPLKPESSPEPLATPDPGGSDSLRVPAHEGLENRPAPAPAHRWWPLAVGVVLLALIAVLVTLYLKGSNSAPPKIHPAAPAQKPTTVTVAARNPTGQPISVVVPQRVTRAGRVVSSLQVGPQLFVLAGNRVWRFDVTNPPDTKWSVPLGYPEPPLAADGSGAISLSSRTGREYVIDTSSLAVQDCQPLSAVPCTAPERAEVGA
jgi:hypothetical protein